MWSSRSGTQDTAETQNGHCCELHTNNSGCRRRLLMAEQGLDVRQLLEPGEGPFVRDFFCGLQEPAPCHTRECAADADPPYAEVRCLCDSYKGCVDQQVHRLG